MPVLGQALDITAAADSLSLHLAQTQLQSQAGPLTVAAMPCWGQLLVQQEQSIVSAAAEARQHFILHLASGN